MKFKYLIVLLIFFISLTAVSAANDNATDIVAGPLDDDTPDVVDIDSEIYEDGNDVVIRINKESSDNISVSVDDVEYINKPLNTCNQSSPGSYFIEQKEIEPLKNRGQYMLKVKFNNTEISKNVNVLLPVQFPDVITSLGDGFCNLHGEINSGAHINIFIDDVLCYDGNVNKAVIGETAVAGSDINWPSNFQYGKHKVKVVFNNTKKTYILEQDFEYTFDLYMSVLAMHNSVAFPAPNFVNNVRFYIKLPKDATNDVKITFEGNTYTATPKNGKVELIVPFTDLKLGKHTAYVSYEDSKYPLRTINSTFTVIPAILWPEEMSYGEKELISIITPKGTSGKVNIYYRYWETNDKGTNQYVNGGLLATVDVKDGYGSYDLSKLDKADYRFTVNYDIDGFNGSWIYNTENNEIEIFLYKNNKDFSSSISASEIKYGENAVVKLKSSKIKDKISIYLDDKLYKTVSMSSGKISQKFAGLTPGKHKISLRYHSSTKFYSKTYYVTVKPIVIKLALKKVKVKKSAKKLVIKATLKVDGKKAKGKKLKFKFNKKTYTAKTNKKGVAKITIAKNVLKKLKKGKKITYQVTYLDKTVKKTVKVSK